MYHRLSISSSRPTAPLITGLLVMSGMVEFLYRVKVEWYADCWL